MADVTIPTGKPTGLNATTRVFIAGEVIESGEVVYQDASDAGKVKLADADTDAASRAVGIALCESYGNQPVVVATSGQLVYTGGSPFTQGLVYCVSTNAGAMCPEADIGSGDYKTVLGVARSSGVFDLNINATGVTENA
jgi:hypothetical protein